MDRLGHSTSRMTIEVYSHATTAMQDQAVATLDAFYKKADAKIGRQIGRQTEIPDSGEVYKKPRDALSDAG